MFYGVQYERLRNIYKYSSLMAAILPFLLMTWTVFLYIYEEIYCKYSLPFTTLVSFNKLSPLYASIGALIEKR